MSTLRRVANARPSWLVVAFVLPLTFALASLHRGHHGDQEIFRSWSKALAGAPSRAYVTPRHDVEYPVLGVAVAVAPALVAPGRDFGATSKLLLWPWNALLIVAFARAARGLRLPSPRTTALLFYLLPATWVCALYFGQIDGVTAALQLVVAWAGVEVLVRGGDDVRGGVGYFVVALLALQASLLTKQLAVFAAPGLVALILLGLLAWRRAGHRRAAWLGLTGLAASFALLRLPDLFLTLPPGYRSHLVWVFSGVGPPHSKMIGNAPGVFAFADLAPDAPSTAPLAAGLSAESIGHVLFALFAVLLTTLFVRAVSRSFARPDSGTALASTALLYAGLCHLGVAVLIAGAHERHVFNALPLLALGLGVRGDASPERGLSFARGVLYGTWGVGAVYGLFVLSTIEWDAFAHVPILRSSRLCAALCLGLLCAATVELATRGRACAAETVRAARSAPSLRSRA